MKLAVFLQRYWADNQVSCTASFDPQTEAPQIAPLLQKYDKDLKAISFLPLTDGGAYAQMPYEAITQEHYQNLAPSLQKIKWREDSVHDQQDVFCDGGTCLITS